MRAVWDDDLLLLQRTEKQTRVPRVNVRLVGGYKPKDELLLWTLVGREEPGTIVLRRAALFAFSPSGLKAARAASSRLRDVFSPASRPFVARVVVWGDENHPQEVVEAWRLEGTKPVQIRRYAFE